MARMNEGSAARFSNVRLGTGPRLHYVESGKHDGEPVVFLHGWPDSWFSFSRVRPSCREPSCCGRRPARLRGLRSPGIRLFHSRTGGERDRLSRRPRDRARDAGRAFVRQLRRAARSFHTTAEGCRPGVDRDRLRVVESRRRELPNILRDLPDPIPVEFARDFQASTAYRPLPPEFFETMIAESLKLPRVSGASSSIVW